MAESNTENETGCLINPFWIMVFVSDKKVYGTSPQSVNHDVSGIEVTATPVAGYRIFDIGFISAERIIARPVLKF